MSKLIQGMAATAGLMLAFGAQAGVTVSAGSLGPSFITLSAANVAGGAIYTLNALPGAAIPANAAPLISTSGDWIAAGPSNTNNGGGDAVLTLAPGTTAVSFLWGSPDTYNSFSVGTSLSGFLPYTGAAMALAAGGFPTGGSQSQANYVTLTGTAGDYITSIAFKSPGTNAIEISNVTVVPEPEAYGMALAAIGVIGFMLRRRRAAAQAA